MNLTYYGHSAFQIEAGGATLLFDPFITGNPLAEAVISAGDLNPDVILLTHAHGDHWGDTVEIAKRSNALVIANYEITQYLSGNHGHANVHPMNFGGTLSFDWGKVTQTYARHSSSFPDGTYGGNPGGFILQADDRCVYNLGDTDIFSEMAWIGEEHDIDLACMPIGDCFTMGPARSIHAAHMLRPKRIMPMHYNTFPPIEVDLAAWEQGMNDAGFTGQICQPGETFVI